MRRLALPVVAIALAGCQTTQLAAELPKPPVMERTDGRSASESEATAEAGRRDIATCNAEAARADRAGTLPISPEQRMALLRDFSHAKAYAAYEQARSTSTSGAWNAVVTGAPTRPLRCDNVQRDRRRTRCCDTSIYRPPP